MPRYAAAVPQVSKSTYAVVPSERGIVTVTLSPITNLSTVSSVGAICVAKYDLSVVDEITTLKPYQSYAGFVNCVPCISWLTSSTQSVRYKLVDRPFAAGFSLYTGQTILNDTPTFEIWSLGNGSIVNTVEAVYKVGVLLDSPSEVRNFDIDPCIITTGGSSGFGNYMTTCTL